MLNYYKILEVSPQASQQEIKSAFRKKARELHPDLQPQSDRLAFQQVVEAYRILSEPYSRKQYDLYSSLFASFSSPESFDFSAPFEWFSNVLRDISPLHYLENFKKRIMSKITGSMRIQLLGNVRCEVPLFLDFPLPQLDVLSHLPDPVWYSLGNGYFKFSIINKTILYYQQALDAFHHNYMEKAEKLLMQAIKLHPQFVLPYIALGNIYRQSGNFEKAIYYYEHVRTLDSTGIPGIIAAKYIQTLAQ